MQLTIPRWFDRARGDCGFILGHAAGSRLQCGPSRRAQVDACATHDAASIDPRADYAGASSGADLERSALPRCQWQRGRRCRPQGFQVRPRALRDGRSQRAKTRRIRPRRLGRSPVSTDQSRRGGCGVGGQLPERLSPLPGRRAQGGASRRTSARAGGGELNPERLAVEEQRGGGQPTPQCAL